MFAMAMKLLMVLMVVVVANEGGTDQGVALLRRHCVWGLHLLRIICSTDLGGAVLMCECDWGDNVVTRQSVVHSFTNVAQHGWTSLKQGCVARAISFDLVMCSRC